MKSERKNPLLLEPDFIAEGLRTYQTYTNHPRYFMQWSRRFIGLELSLTLTVAGWKGYADVIRKQAAPGNIFETDCRPPDGRLSTIHRHLYSGRA